MEQTNLEYIVEVQYNNIEHLLKEIKRANRFASQLFWTLQIENVVILMVVIWYFWAGGRN